MWYGKYSTSKLIYCQEPDSSEKKPECEICGGVAMSQHP